MKSKVIVLGHLPPPVMGPSVACQIILESDLQNSFTLIHLNLSDPRGQTKRGKLAWGNVVLALKQWYELAWLLWHHRPHLVYIPNNQTTLGYLKDSGFIVLAKLFRAKVVCHLRGGNFANWYQSLPWAGRLAVKTIHSLVDAQIVLAQRFLYLFAEVLPLAKIHVVPNGRDFPPTSLTKAATPVRVLYLGNYIRSKGALDFLYASERIVQHTKDVQLVFAGSWREREVQEEFTAFQKAHPELPLRVLGAVQGVEKWQLLASSHILVFPTYYPAEGLPWVLIEAMAHKLAIVTTDHAAIPEWVQEGKNGFLVPPRQPECTAQRVIQLVKDTALREQMAQNSYQTYQQNFREKTMIGGLHRVWQEVIQ